MSATDMTADPGPGADALRIAQQLIRLDTTNFGPGNSRGETAAAEYLEACLEEVGVDCELFDSAPTRTNMVLRIPGRDRSLPALLVHGHLDVVPADESEWSRDPFGGEISAGALWGRGAVDMKNMDAMVTAAIRSIARRGITPPRDVIVAFFADEEAGSAFGAEWLVREHPELFDNVGYAVGEVGGFSVTLPGGRRAYLLQAGEKGILWLRLTARGPAGHSSQRFDRPAAEVLCTALGRVAGVSFDISLNEVSSALLEGLRSSAGHGQRAPLSTVLSSLGPASRLVEPGLRTTVNLTRLNAGYKENVVPSEAVATLDVRYVPGDREHVLEKLAEVLGPEIEVDIVLDLESVSAPLDTAAVVEMTDTLLRHDAGAHVLPYFMPAGTDAKFLTRAGIPSYGFVPLRLPDGFDFASMFHGVDERIPLEALDFGTKVILDLLCPEAAGRR